MGLRSNVSQRQRRLGQELRKLREAAGVPRAEACRHIGIHTPHLSNIEAGRTACSEARLRALAAVYGCTNEPLVDALVEMSNATGKGWWSPYAKTLESRIIDLAELESAATAHRSFQWLYIPGLLQTPDYMRSLFTRTSPTAPVEVIEEYVNFRLRRQQALVDEPLPDYHAVIHEAAFHMKFVDREVMLDQLEYLVQLAHFPNITIQVLPFSADAHPATPGAPYTLLDAQVPELCTIHVEQPVASVFLGDQPHINRFATDFARLSSVSLASLDLTGQLGEGSLGLIHHLLYLMKEGRHAGP
ncbi:helix-turn-helix domain-containing protein [Streptomyces sp. enrichment culture]|uniref:helix-turn-helix domain-containing protein n=1 Tax=Streptomyces sp. enrichment culture TaxID=1795815 RepID=UPI003F55EC36